MTEQTNTVAVTEDAPTKELVRTRELVLKNTVELTQALFGHTTCLVINSGIVITTGNQLESMMKAKEHLETLINKALAEKEATEPVETAQELQ